MKVKKVKKIISLTLVICFIVLMAAGCSFGRQGKKTGKGSEVGSDTNYTKLAWYLRGAAPKNSDLVTEKANEIIADKIGAVVDFKFVQPGDYNQKMQMIMASSEEFDLCFTSDWANSYVPNVKKGAYIPIDDLLDKFPRVKEIFSDEIWGAAKVGSKIYAVPNYQVLYAQQGMWFNKKLVDKYNIDLSTVNKISDLTAIYEFIKEKEPTVSPILSGVPWILSRDFPMQALDDGGSGFIVDTETWEVYDTSSDKPRVLESKKNVELMREWYLKDFFPADVATAQNLNVLIKTGTVFSGYAKQKPGGEEDFKIVHGLEVVMKALTDAVITRSSVLAALTAISNTSKNPTKAMELIELMNVDKELLNYMVHGIEGQDYVKKAENKIAKLPDSYGFNAWQFGNQLNAYLLEGQDDNLWKETKEMNDNAYVDPLISFSFNSTNVESEIAQIIGIGGEFGKIIDSGLDDPKSISEIVTAKRKLAGRDKILNELQEQINAWKSSN